MATSWARLGAMMVLRDAAGQIGKIAYLAQVAAKKRKEKNRKTNCKAGLSNSLGACGSQAQMATKAELSLLIKFENALSFLGSAMARRAIFRAVAILAPAATPNCCGADSNVIT
ncbi:MAG: hypothetical protein K1X64_23660 [Myxococcaceae bacterium]|nr:hypothetical protein [Myxococcaceae bacterium]